MCTKAVSFNLSSTERIRIVESFGIRLVSEGEERPLKSRRDIVQPKFFIAFCVDFNCESDIVLQLKQLNKPLFCTMILHQYNLDNSCIISCFFS